MLKFAANLTMMFNEVPFLERFDAAAKAGFKGVEYLFPYDFEPAVLKAALDKNQLTQVLFNMPPGDWAQGDRGLACLYDRVAAFQEGVHESIRYANVLQCKQIHAMAGLVPPDKNVLECEQTYIKNIQYAADHCAAHDLRVLIEPINTRDMPCYFLTTQKQAEALLVKINRPNVFIQLDLYHCQIMEGDLMKTIERLSDKFCHIQIASVPERHEPDQGEVNYAWIFKKLAECQYQGWIGCEYRPEGNTQAGLTWFNPYK